jgi:hypothetical protein
MTSLYQPGEAWKGNAAGRPSLADKVKKPTARQLKDRELLMLLRKIRPHVADSILAASRIMGNQDAKDADKLKAATVILDNYRKLVIDLYDGADPGEDALEIQPENRPAFSLRVIEGDDVKQIEN